MSQSEPNQATTDIQQTAQSTSQETVVTEHKPKLATEPHSMPWLKTFEKYGMDYDIELPPADMSLIDVFERNFAQFGDKTAFVCMNATISFRELDIKSRQVAAYLQGLGLKKGDNVAVMLPNILQYPVCMIGILRAGLTLVNVNLR